MVLKIILFVSVLFASEESDALPEGDTMWDLLSRSPALRGMVGEFSDDEFSLSGSSSNRATDGSENEPYVLVTISGRLHDMGTNVPTSTLNGIKKQKPNSPPVVKNFRRSPASYADAEDKDEN